MPIPAAVHIHRHTPALEARLQQELTQGLQAVPRLLREWLPRANQVQLLLRQLQLTTGHTGQIPHITEVQAVVVQPTHTGHRLQSLPNPEALTALRQEAAAVAATAPPGAPALPEATVLPADQEVQEVQEVQDLHHLHQAEGRIKGKVDVTILLTH